MQRERIFQQSVLSIAILEHVVFAGKDNQFICTSYKAKFHKLSIQFTDFRNKKQSNFKKQIALNSVTNFDFTQSHSFTTQEHISYIQYNHVLTIIKSITLIFT